MMRSGRFYYYKATYYNSRVPGFGRVNPFLAKLFPFTRKRYMDGICMYHIYRGRYSVAMDCSEPSLFGAVTSPTTASPTWSERYTGREILTIKNGHREDAYTTICTKASKKTEFGVENIL